MERFLRYSLERGRKIRAVLCLDGKLIQRAVLVTALADGRVTLLVGARKAPVTIPVSDVLSCDYARGDHGEDA